LQFTVASLAANGGGPLAIERTSWVVFDGAVEMHHPGGTADLPGSIECSASAFNSSTAQTVSMAGPARIEVFGQSNHNAYVTLPLVGAAEFGPGSWNVTVECHNNWAASGKRIDSAQFTLEVVPST
jgi:hypothetical protein